MTSVDVSYGVGRGFSGLCRGTLLFLFTELTGSFVPCSSSSSSCALSPVGVVGGEGGRATRGGGTVGDAATGRRGKSVFIVGLATGEGKTATWSGFFERYLMLGPTS